MFVKNRFWFLRFAEGTEGAAAGGAGDDGSKVDLESRVKELEAERDTWKKHSRTWEDRAKAGDADANANAGVKALEDQVAELREAAAKTEAGIKIRERKALIATVAAEEGVAKDDLQYLPDSDDEEVVRKFAKRLATVKRGAESNNFGGGSGASRQAIIDRAKNL